MGLEIAVCISILLIVLFLATVDMAFSHLSDLGLRRLATDSEEGSPQRTYEFLREIVDNRPLFRFAITSTIQVLLIAFTVVVVVTIARYTLDRTSILFYSLLVGLIATLVFRQLLPRMIVRNNPEGILLVVLPVVRPLYALASLIASPFASLFRSRDHQQKLEATVTPDSPDDKEDDDEDIQALLEVGEAEGILEEGEREMIESMVEFAETRIGEIMTPPSRPAQEFRATSDRRPDPRAPDRGRVRRAACASGPGSALGGCSAVWCPAAAPAWRPALAPGRAVSPPAPPR